MIDIDHFKRLNDRHGHAVGDLVLRAVAEAIAGAVREDDVPARYGGEEFAVLLRNPSEQVAVEIGERVRASVAGLDLREFGPSAVTVSVGVAISSAADQPIDDLIAEADRALYRAKRAGRDRVDHRLTRRRRGIRPPGYHRAMPADDADGRAATDSTSTRPIRRPSPDPRHRHPDERRPGPDLPRDRRHARGQGRARLQDRGLSPGGRRHRPQPASTSPTRTAAGRGRGSPASARRSPTRSPRSSRPAGSASTTASGPRSRRPSSRCSRCRAWGRARSGSSTTSSASTRSTSCARRPRPAGCAR